MDYVKIHYIQCIICLEKKYNDESYYEICEKCTNGEYLKYRCGFYDIKKDKFCNVLINKIYEQCIYHKYNV